MRVTTKAIVLSSIKYGDTSLIVRAYTATDGLKTYLLKGILGSKKGKLKAAYFQPLMQLEVVAIHRNKGSLERLQEVKTGYAYQTLHTNMAKNAITLFLSEILSHSIYEEEKNAGLYNFLEASFQWLDTHEHIANFHLFFLLELTKYFGFYPDTSTTRTRYFDLLDGQFIEGPSLNPVLSGTNLEFFIALLGTNFDGMHTIGMGKSDRQELLQKLVLFFELHLHGFKKPRSLAILNEVFN
ncbi:MAG: DNA repair protein RecO [Eudoraea sp.]|nr:DNA repair protein RecO [Eudoraea sp.]